MHPRKCFRRSGGPGWSCRQRMSRACRFSFAAFEARSVYGRRWTESDFKGDAAIQAAAFLGVFGAQRLGGADSARAQIRRRNAATQQPGADLLGALLAEKLIRTFDAAAVGVADEFDGSLFAEVFRLGHDVANLFLCLGERVFLAGLKVGSADGEEKGHRLDCALRHLELQ